MDQTYRIALWQGPSPEADIKVAFATLGQAMRAAGAMGAKMLVAPELYLPGYNQDSLQDLLRSVVSDGDLRGTGFDMKDIQTLIDDVTDEPNDKRKRNLEPFEDSFFLIRCPVTDQGRAMRMIQEALQDVVGVEIASATR